MSVKPIEAGGPLFLIVMLKEITTVSQDSIRALSSRITGFKISDVLGENCSKGCKPPTWSHHKVDSGESSSS